MSSFIGHSLPALSVYFSGPHFRPNSPTLKHRGLWFLTLIMVAWAPDIDHFVPALNAASHQGLRITHSLVACLILPICVILMLRLQRLKRAELGFLASQVLLVALSHLGLDMLTGAMSLPLLYPFSQQLFKLPFGLLPSAGKISFSNYYLYRNLVIELGVLLPLFASIHLMAHARKSLSKKQFMMVFLLSCSVGFMVWAASLSR
jgi:hypothetical protein